MDSLCGLNGHVVDVMTRKNGVSASTLQMLGLGSPRRSLALAPKLRSCMVCKGRSLSLSCANVARIISARTGFHSFGRYHSPVSHEITTRGESLLYLAG
jgi:hypothetical protein